MSAHVLMLRTNPHRPDPAVARAARTLAGAGYRVTLVCWDRAAERPRRERDEMLDVVRVQQVRSEYGRGWTQLPRLRAFWSEAIRVAVPLAPDIVHCHDLDTLPAGWMLKRRLGCALVYDAHENYPLLMSLQLPRVLVWALTLLERRLLRHVDATVTADTVLRDEWRGRGVSPVVAVGNWADLRSFDAVTDAAVERMRAELGAAPGRMLVGYLGGFTHDRLLRPFLEAARHVPQADFHLWGDGPQRALVETAAATRANVRYHGWLDAGAVPLCFRALDVVYYGLRDYRGSVYAAPNALGLAMAAGRPLVASGGGDLRRIVRETECGVLVEEPTPEAIAIAIRRLLAPAERARLGANGRRAACERFNAATQQRPLLDVYDDLRRKRAGGRP